MSSDLSAFESLAEFAIALAGFGSVVVVLRRGEDRMHPADRYRVLVALVPSLVAGFLALLPVGLDLTGLPRETTWLVVGCLYAVVVSALGAMIVRRALRLPLEARAVLSGRLVLINSVGVGVSIVAVLLNAATPLLGPSRGGFYFFGVLFLLVVSANAFVRMVFIRPEA